jgi:hypothetical protein
MCFCSLTYPASNAHATYCHLWPAPLDHILPLYPINGTIFGKKVMEHKMRVFIFSTYLSQIFLIVGKITRDMFEDVHVKYPLFS